MTVAAIIVAAGRGTRAGGDRPKQWQLLQGRPVVAVTRDALAPLVDRLVVVIHPDDRALAARHLPGTELCEGADNRAGSVRAGLEALADAGVERVLIHDAARPLVDAALVARLVEALDRAAAAAPGVPVADALWRGADGFIAGHADRSGLWRAQTPQAFRFAPILAAHRAHAGAADDDVAVARAAGLAVALVEGVEENFKLTWPGDLARAERILRERAGMDIRAGNGFDVHAFGPGDHVWLCGLRLPHGAGLVGHSDADVGMHALTDAIYGALAEGDIGRHFPPADPQWRGAASEIFLRHAAGLAAARGFRLTHADVTLICERPKIGPHAAAMQARLAAILDVTPDRISVKATTSERLGFTGREEGIAALATATLVRP